MKQRRLSLLLVIALLVSVLVPSFALAAEATKPSITVSNKDAYTKEFYFDQYTGEGTYISVLTPVKEDAAYVAVALEEKDMGDITSGTLYWTTSDASVVKFYVDGEYVDTAATAKNSVPTLVAGGDVGKATIKADRFKAPVNGQTQVVELAAYPSFDITLTKLEVTKVELNKDWSEKDASFNMDLIDVKHGLDLSTYAWRDFDFTPDSYAAFGAYDFDWALTEGKDIAKLWASGVLFPQKAGKIVVTATAKADTKVKMTYTINVTDPDGAAEEAEEREGAESFEFTQDEFTINIDDPITHVWTWDFDDEQIIIPDPTKVDFDTDRFLKVEGNRSDLRWTSSNPELVSVDLFSGFLNIENAKAGDKVTITVTSYADDTKTKSADIKFVENEEEKETPVEKVSFSPAKVSWYHIYPLCLDDFVKADPIGASYDLTYTVDKPELATITEDDGFKYLKVRDGVEEGTVVVTATDKETGESGTLTVTFTKYDPEATLIEEMAFVPSTVSLYCKDSLKVDDYLNTKPGLDVAQSDLTITVDKPDIAFIKYERNGDSWIDPETGKVEYGYSPYLYLRNNVEEGTVKVTVSDALSGKSTTTPLTVNITNVDTSTAITKVAFTPKTLNVYQDDTINLWDYLRVTWEPAVDEWPENSDYIVWSVSDATTGEVYQDEDGAWLRLYKSTGKVTVAATSFFKEITNTIEINIIGESEPVKATSLKFVPRTLNVWGEENLEQYLKIEPADAVTAINWSIDPTNSDANVAAIDSHGDLVWNTNKAGKVRVVALDKNSELYDFIDVTFVEPELSTKVKAIAFAPAEVTVDTNYGSVDLDAYLKVEPLDADYEINYVSSDSRIASIYTDDVEDDDGEFHKHTFAAINKSGIVKITATVKDQPEVAAATLTLVINDATVPYDTVKFAGAPTTAYAGDGLEDKSSWLDLSSFLITGPENAAFYDELIWTSSNQQIAAVANDWMTISVHDWEWVPGEEQTEEDRPVLGTFEVGPGSVQFLRPGTVTITVRSKLNPAKTDSVTITVKETSNPIQTITVTQDTFTLKTYDFEPYFFQRYLVITPADYDDDLIWTSSDPEVVSVEGSVATLGKPGTAKVTVRSLRNPAATASFTVVHEAEALKSIAFIADTPKTLNVTDDMQLTEEMRSISLYEYITTDPWYYAYSSDIVFASSDPQIASVNEDGVLWFHKAGKVTVTASYVYDSAVAATTEIERKKVNPTAIKFVKNDIVIATGETIDLGEYVTLEPFTTDYSIDDIRWQVVDTDVADWLWVPDVDDEEEIVNWDNVEWYQLRNEVLHGNEKGETKVNAMLRLDDGSVITGSLNVTVKDYAVEKLAFAKKNYKATFKYDDDTIVMKFNVTPIDATLTRKDLRVNTSKATVAKIVDYGVEYNDDGTVYGWVEVRPLKPGTSKITVSLRDNEKIKATAKVTIDSIAVKRIKLPKKTLRMYFYELNEDNVYQNVYHLKSFIQPYNAYAESITWETTDASVCFVNNLDRVDGVPYADLIATGAGSATITLKVDDGKKVRTQTMKVVVSTKTVDLKLNAKKATINMIKGGDNTFQLEAFDAKSEEAVAVKWKSSNKKVATVDKNGLVTAKKAGTAVITATTKDGDELTASCNVTVNKLKVTSIKAKKALSLKVGAEADLTIKVKPADAFNNALKFKSSDSSVLYVNKAGHIEAKKAGTAVITVKTTDGSKLSLEITVTVTK